MSLYSNVLNNRKVDFICGVPFVKGKDSNIYIHECYGSLRFSVNSMSVKYTRLRRINSESAASIKPSKKIYGLIVHTVIMYGTPSFRKKMEELVTSSFKLYQSQILEETITMIDYSGFAIIADDEGTTTSKIKMIQADAIKTVMHKMSGMDIQVRIIPVSRISDGDIEIQCIPMVLPQGVANVFDIAYIGLENIFNRSMGMGMTRAGAMYYFDWQPNNLPGFSLGSVVVSAPQTEVDRDPVKDIIDCYFKAFEQISQGKDIWIDPPLEKRHSENLTTKAYLTRPTAINEALVELLKHGCIVNIYIDKSSELILEFLKQLQTL